MKKLAKFISLTLSMTLTATSLLTPNLFTAAVDTAAESTDDGELAATSSIGSTLMGLVGEQESENAETADTGCNINDVTFEVSSKTVTVRSIQNADCRLTVGLYNDEGTELLESKTVDITADSTENTVTLASELPEYYIIKAFLTDDLQRPLCKARAYEDATQEMQAIKAATISDFDQSLVINLDESSDTNFLVLSEGAVTAVSSDAVNTLVSEDIENGVYTFDNIDETVSSLEEGDVFCVQPSEDDIVAVVVGSVIIDGDSAEIIADKEKASQIFDFIKIETDSTGSQPTVDMSEATEGVVAVDDPGDDFFKEYEDKINSEEEVPRFDPDAAEEISSVTENTETASPADIVSLGGTQMRGGIGDIDISETETVSQAFTGSMKICSKDIDGFDLKLSVSAKIGIDVSFTFYHDAILFEKDYNFFEYIMSETLEKGVSVEIGIEDDIKEVLKKKPKADELKLGKITIPLGATGIDVGVEVKVVYSLKGALTVFSTKTSIGGSRYSTDEGWSDIKDDNDDNINEISVKAEGEFFIGLKLEAYAEALKGVVKLSVPITFGLKISASAEIQQAFSRQYPDGDVATVASTENTLHLCSLCIDGDISLEFNVSFDVSLLFEIIENEFSLYNLSVKLGDFYWNPHDLFGWGECPNQFCNVTVVVTDEQGNPVKNAEVTIDDVDLSTNINGKAVFYVRSGSDKNIRVKYCGNTYGARLIVGGYALTKYFTVTDDVSDKASASVEYEGHTYQIFESGLEWADAQAYCKNLGGHLAVITSAEEQAAIEALLSDGTKNSYWIGAEYVNGNWVWVTYEKFDYSNWAPGQPDNPGKENALMIYTAVNPNNVSGSGFGTWNDLKEDCTYESESFFGTDDFGFVCEWENSDSAAVVSTTTTTTTTSAATTTTTTTSANINDVVYKAAAKPVTVDGIITFTFDKAAAGTEYLLAACTNADDVLGSLVYIDQRTADENGTVTFTFAEPAAEVTYVFVGDFGRGDYCRTSGTLDIENETCTICGHAVSDIMETAGIALGDVNGDSAVDSSDAAMILQHYALVQSERSGKFTEAVKIVADYNHDDSVDSSDAALILKAYADLQAA